MVVVSVCLAAWVGIVWWQDKRTAHIHVLDNVTDSKLEEEIEMPESQIQNKDQ